ncbi:hypothetical protein ZIOFF_035516 [Zingiber officinale]|uniref:Uncharacterized protein n=1 Tax=Zingiber officinale TaxID=94328 RepID=A0A8J5G8Z5_ZINOF|nr:hypothetical protein ZIOFF_035516 [Zingiber officinale]
MPSLIFSCEVLADLNFNVPTPDCSFSNKRMVVEIGADSVLDYALFNISSAENSYEVFICKGGKLENIACGPLNQLAIHLAQSHSDHAGDTTAGGHFEGVGPTNTEIEAEASDATKNELLRAIELRIVGLKEELVALFSQAAGATLSVKHLSDLAKFSQHFQVRDLREKILTAKDADENNSGDEQTDQPARKSENTVRRMSVQEAISLFESKQKDNNLDAQKRIASGDSSVINNKTVLRRWNSGLTNSLAHGQGNAYEPVSQSSCVLHVEEDNKMIAENIDSFTTPADLNTASETTQIASLPKIETAAVSKDVPSELASSQTAEIDGATTSADWGKHKEAELNQMLMKMIESKPGKYIDSNTGSVKSSSKVSSDTTPSRRRSHLVSPTPPSPKIEKPLHQPREESEAKTDTKRINRVQGEKKHKTPVSTKITVKAKNPTASPDESGSSAAKPSFYDKVTKKGSVVPLEAKSARKFSGTGRVGGRSLTKSRIIQSDASSKKSDNSIQVEEKEQTPEIIDKVLEADLAEQANDLDANLVTSLDNCLNLEKTETGNQSLADVDVDVNHNSLEIPVAEIQPDEDISISSAAWVELEQCEVSTAYDTGLTNASVSNVHEPSLV